MAQDRESNKEKLVRIEVKTDNLITLFDRHLAHHWAFTKIMIGTGITVGIGLIGLVFRLVYCQ